MCDYFPILCHVHNTSPVSLSSSAAWESQTRAILRELVAQQLFLTLGSNPNYMVKVLPSAYDFLRRDKLFHKTYPIYDIVWKKY